MAPIVSAQWHIYRKILWNQTGVADLSPPSCSCPKAGDKVSRRRSETIGRRQTDDLRNETTTEQNPAKSRSFLVDARETDDVRSATTNAAIRFCRLVDDWGTNRSITQDKRRKNIFFLSLPLRLSVYTVQKLKVCVFDDWKKLNVGVSSVNVWRSNMSFCSGFLRCC